MQQWHETTERDATARKGEKVEPQIPRVWSCNEWDPLEEVIVGNPLQARFPTPDPSTQMAEFPDRSLAEIPRGPFPQRIIEETEEDLHEFIRILEGQGVTVKRPQTWPHAARFSTIHWEAQGYYNLECTPRLRHGNWVTGWRRGIAPPSCEDV
jgi:hypothetical protein